MVESKQGLESISAETEKKIVIKRDGTSQPVDQYKIRKRLVNKSHGLNEKFINFDVIVNKVYNGIYSGKALTNIYINSIGVTTVELDNLAAETCAYMNMVHPDYSKLAARIAVSCLHKQTSDSFLEVVTRLKDYKD
jgi:ribonucleoside-diphosphate reductase subunit M1